MKQAREGRRTRPAAPSNSFTILVSWTTFLLFVVCVVDHAAGFSLPQKNFQFSQRQPILCPGLSTTTSGSIKVGRFNSCLWAKPRWGSNKKKQKGPARPPKATKSSKNSSKKSAPPSSQAAAFTGTTTVAKKSSSHSVPPWQVLSPKDAKKNMAREQERRARINQGLADPHEDDGKGSEKFILSKAFHSATDQSLLNWKRFNPITAPASMQLVASLLGKSSRLPTPLGVPEIAFLGRSNVGKSSLLNKLGRNDAARVGKTPGATASVNLYSLMDAKEQALLGLVDLPGFGYAKLSKSIQEDVQLAAERYLGRRKELALGILLVDIRRIPSDDDRAVLAALYDLGVPIVVVATKVDKISNNERGRQLEEIRLGLGLPEGQPLCVSSITGEGTKQLWRIMLEACETGVQEFQQKLERRGSSDETHEGEEEGYSEDIYLEDDAGEDVEYSQGYDWIHGTVDYEQDEYDDDIDDDNFVLDNPQDQQQSDQPIKETIKSLKQRARRIERSGQV